MTLLHHQTLSSVSASYVNFLEGSSYCYGYSYPPHYASQPLLRFEPSFSQSSTLGMYASRPD